MINLMNSRHFGTTVSIAALAGALALAPAAHARDGNGYAVSPENPHSVQLLVAGRFGTPSPYQSGTDHSLDTIPPLAVSPENPHSVQLLLTGRLGTPDPYQSGTDHSLDTIPSLAVSPENPHSVQLLAAGRFGTPTPVVDPKNSKSSAIAMEASQS
jgi:hypothetical protein